MAGRPIPRREVKSVTPVEEPAAIIAGNEEPEPLVKVVPTSAEEAPVAAGQPATKAPPERPRRFTQPVVPVEQPREKMIPFTTALRDPLLEELRTYCRENRVQIVDVVNRGVELALDEAYKARDAH